MSTESQTHSQPASGGLRIGIDGTCLALRRGYGRFLRELLPPLLKLDRRNEYVLFVDRHAVRDIPSLPVKIVEPDTRESQVDAPSARGNRALGDVFTMGRAVAREKLDLMYFPSVFSWFPVRGVKTAVAFHDTIAERYAKVVFPTFRTRMLWKLKVGLARRQATGIVTVSEWSKRSLASWFKIPEERIFVTPEAPSPEFGPVLDPGPRRAWLTERGFREDARYLIYVGGFNPHKNLRMLLHAFADVTAEDPADEVHFLLVGDYQGDTFHSEVSVLQGIIAERGLTDRVHFVGFVPDAALRDLYAGAVALAIPSLEEGFGLPAVEAAACGAPCIATRNSPLPEVLEGGGIFVDPEDAPGLTGAVRAMLRDPVRRDDLAAQALTRAGEMSWDVTAEATRHALETIAGRSGRG